MIGMKALSLSLALLSLAPSIANAQRKEKRRIRTDHGRRVAAVARTALQQPIRMRRHDCSGFVEAVLRDARVPRQGNTRSFYFDALREKRLHFRAPRQGDLVFFDRTYDRNDNGRLDDPLTHIAIVTYVEKDGTVVMVHRGNSGVRTLRMNLKRRALHRGPDGEIYNDFLAQPGYGHRRLTGQVFRAFARPPRR